MNELLGLCEGGLRDLFAVQRTAIEGLGIKAPVPAIA
jgi:hypothetical protein